MEGIIRPSGNMKWLQIYGVDKNAKDVHMQLRALGFRWDFRAFRWWGPNTSSNLEKVKEITGFEYLDPITEAKPQERAS